MRERDLKGRFVKDGVNNIRIVDELVYLCLNSNNEETVFDLCDLDLVKQYHWNIVRKKEKKYVFTRIEQKTHQFHRIILGLTDSKIYVDHIDGNGLNNRRSNLRLATNGENQQNTGASSNSRLGMRGISICKSTGRYKCQLSKNKKLIYHERFDSLDEAKLAMAYARQRNCTHLQSNHEYVINIHAVINGSEVNGPGNRIVVWTQGCTKGCKGCFNENTWNFKRKNLMTVKSLAEIIFSSKCDGLTLTGGDALEQPEALLEFLKLLHTESGELLPGILPKGIICFTGFLIEELTGAALECLRYIDLLIDGRYVEKLRYTNGLAGSSNQRFHFSKAVGRGEFLIPRAEVLIDQSIEVHVDDSDIIQVTGFPSIDRKFLRDYGLDIESSDS
jgi:anaerobic ribonucleoside-triphosphate reductase activating protein